MKTDSTELRGKASSQDQQDRRIAAILGNAETPVTDKTLRRYLKYIKSKLTLPCDVNGMNHERGRKFRLYEVNFDTRDEMYGLIGLAKGLRDRCTYQYTALRS